MKKSDAKSWIAILGLIALQAGLILFLAYSNTASNLVLASWVRSWCGCISAGTTAIWIVSLLFIPLSIVLGYVFSRLKNLESPVSKHRRILWAVTSLVVFMLSALVFLQARFAVNF